MMDAVSGNELKITFGGKAWAALRQDQKDYVQQLMLSWHAVSGMWYDSAKLRRAIAKAKQNIP